MLYHLRLIQVCLLGQISSHFDLKTSMWIALLFYLRALDLEERRLQLWSRASRNLDRSKINGQETAKWRAESRDMGSTLSIGKEEGVSSSRPPSRAQLLDQRRTQGSTASSQLPKQGHESTAFDGGSRKSPRSPPTPQ